MILIIADGEEKILTRVRDLLAGETQYIQLSSEKEFALLFPGLTIYPDQYRIFMGEREVNLTNLEFGVLLYLAQRPQCIFSKRQIQEAVWKEETESYENAVQCIISGLRKKLKKYSNKEYIQTVRGVGYKFEIPEA